MVVRTKIIVIHCGQTILIIKIFAPIIINESQIIVDIVSKIQPLDKLWLFVIRLSHSGRLGDRKFP